MERTPRQKAILESIELGEVGYSAYLGGFYFNRTFQFQLADKDQAFLNRLFVTGQITHSPAGGAEFEVQLCREYAKR